MKLLFVILFLSLVGCTKQSSQHIPSPDMLESTFDEQAASPPLVATLHKPEGDGLFPTVVLMHGCSGLIREANISLLSYANFLNENGYSALILDSFGGRKKEGGMVCNSLSELSKARNYRQEDAYNALQYLKTLTYVDKNNIFLMGQSNGGSVALSIANKVQSLGFSDTLKFRAIAAFYPWCGALPHEIKTPLLVLGGEADNWTPIKPCLVTMRNSTDIPFDVISYEGAHHSFDFYIPVQSYSGHTVGGNSAARDDSKKQMLNWFNQFRVQ